MATSVLPPKEIPTCAFANAGASLMPSPTIADKPSLFNCSIFSSFSCGSCSPYTVSIPMD